MGGADQWRWTDEDGVQRLLGADELRTALNDGRLKSSTLVWRRGMKSWLPAGSVPELNDDDDDDGTIMVAKAKSFRDKAPGQPAPPSASIPPPGPLFDEDTATNVRPKPSNMVDIGELKKQQSTRHDGASNDAPPSSKTVRQLKEDAKAAKAGARGSSAKKKRPHKRGAGKAGRAEPVRPDPKVAIPRAPKLPEFALPGSKKAKKAKVARKGLWSEPDLNEETVTRVRRDDEVPSAGPNSRRLSAPRGGASPARKGSKRPPPPPTSRRQFGKAPAKALSADRPGVARNKAPEQPVVRARTMVSPSSASEGAKGANPEKAAEVDFDVARNASTAPPVAKADGSGDTSPPSARTELLSDDQRGAAASAAVVAGAPNADPVAARRMIPTAPLPEYRPEPSGRQSPRFAQEPWLAEAGGAVADDYIAGRPPLSVAGARMLLAKSWVVKAPAVAVAAGGVLVMVLLSFVVGRVSSAQTGVTSVVEAQTGLATVTLFARTWSSTSQRSRPCLMIRAPARLAPKAAHKIPFEMTATPRGELAIGYARSLEQAAGLVVVPTSGEVVSRYEPEAGEERPSRVVPAVDGDEVSYRATLAEQDGVTAASFVSGAGDLIIGFREGEVVKLSAPGATPETLWALPPAERPPDALNVRHFAGKGTAVAYRYDGRVFYGWLDANHNVDKEAAPVPGSGGQVGKPALGTNGAQIALVFADRPPADGATADVRWARVAPGEQVQDALPIELPVGGPGGDAIAPSVSGLEDGRWVLMWTEGARRAPKTLRAQTYGRDGKTIGQALRVSPGTGSFGQGSVGVVGEDAAVVFLLATRRGYEVWGTVLQCR